MRRKEKWRSSDTSIDEGRQITTTTKVEKGRVDPRRHPRAARVHIRYGRKRAPTAGRAGGNRPQARIPTSDRSPSY